MIVFDAGFNIKTKNPFAESWVKKYAVMVKRATGSRKMSRTLGGRKEADQGEGWQRWRSYLGPLLKLRRVGFPERVESDTPPSMNICV